MNHYQHPIVAALFVLLAGSAHAAQPLVTDDTGTQGQGGKQVEVSHVDAQARLGGDTTRTRTLPLVFTIGVSDTLDLYVGATPTDIAAGTTSVTGWGNTALGAKWRFLENEASRTSLALKPEVRLPVGASQEADGLGTGATSYSLALILTQETDFGAVHVNLGGASDRYSDARPTARTLRMAVAPVWNITDQWRVALEYSAVQVTVDSQSTTTQLVQLGAIYSPSKDLDLAMGLMRSADGTASPTTTTTTTLGLTWRFR